MQKVGVEAVIAGLSSFLGDMKKIDKSISGLIPGTKLLDNAFSFLGNTVDGFVNFTLNALAHALGELIADAIEFVIQKIGELVEATIQAGAEFQTLELRLQTLNFNSLTESGVEFNEAQAESIRLTKEQLEWLQKLAVTTPYDVTDISNTFTLARSYGFVDDEARKLTETISNFAAGMGLGSTEIERIIINFGQMVQQGKVTQREMNDLARGSFVPVNDVLAQMQKNLGMSSDELTAFRQTGEGVDAFMEAFIQLVDQRFSGSAEKMARTFQGATANMQDLIQSIGGLNIIKPILDAIGGRIADFVTELTKGDRWDKLVDAANNVTNAILPILDTFLDLFAPSADSAAEGVINALNGIADWLNKHRDDITNWIIEASRWINNVLIPDIKRVLKWLFGSEDEEGAIQKFGEWIWEVFIPAIRSAAQWGEEVLIPFLKNDLYPVFLALLPLAAALGDVLITAFGGEPNQSFTDWIHNELIPGIEGFTTWITENKDEIALWVNRLVIATIQLAIFAGIVSLAIGFIGTLVAMFINWLATLNPIATVLAIIAVLVLVAFGVPVLAAILAVVVVIGALYLAIVALKALFNTFTEEWEKGWTILSDHAAETIRKVEEAWKNGDWIGVGKAIVEGIVVGIQDFAYLIVNAVSNAAAAAVNDINSVFGIPSPTSSSTAAGATSSSTRNSTNNYNLTVNSNANNENVVQDFNLLQSLGGR